MRRPLLRIAFVASFVALLGVSACSFSFRRMRTAASPRCAFLLAALVVSACSYIFEDTLPSIAALTAGLDAGFDVGVEDAPFVVPPFDGPPPPVAFCAGQTVPFLYCEDFDETQAPTIESIGTKREASGGTIEVANIVSLSTPRSLLATASGVEAGPVATAAVDHVLNQNPDGATLTFSMLVNQWTTSATEVASLQIGATGGPCTIRIGGTKTTWTVKQTCGGTEVVTDSAKPITTKTWIRFALAVQNNPAKLVTLDIDGTRVVSVPGIAGLDRGPLAVTLGLDSVADGNATVFQDNVLVTSP